MEITGDRQERTPLLAAAGFGHSEVVRTLLAVQGIDPNKASTAGTTPLYAAASYGHAEAVKALLAARGIDLDRPEQLGTTPLYMASQNGHVAVVQALAAAGANVNTPRPDGVTPLGIAKNPQVRQLLLQHGAKENCSIR